MKKILLVTALAASLVSNAALAKTEGNYAGLDVLYVQADHSYDVLINTDGFDDSSYGVGAHYKHAFNMNSFFIAPGVFAEYLGNEAKDPSDNKVSIDNRFGAQVDFGYDFSEYFAAYLSLGYASTSYKVDWTNNLAGKKSGRDSSFVYGIGVAFTLNKDIVVSVETNYQNVEPTTPADEKMDTDLNVAKVGVSYHF